MLPALGYGVSGDGFRCCRWVEVDGVWLILSLILGFVQWLSVGCGVGHSGSGGFFGRFRWCWGVGFFLIFNFYFYIAPNIVKYLPEHFLKCNQTLKKKKKKTFSRRSFTSENNLHWKIFNNEQKEPKYAIAE